MQSWIEKLDTSKDSEAEKVIRRLKGFGRPVIPLLIRSAQQTGRPRIRKWSLQALGELGDTRAVPLLIKALKDERMTVRLHAIRGLGRLKSRKAVPHLVRCLKDESGGVRMNALQVLTRMKVKNLAIYRQALKDPSWYMRLEALKGLKALTLKGLGPNGLERVLVRINTTEKHPSVRKAIGPLMTAFERTRERK